MNKFILVLSLFGFSASAFGESRYFEVKGMHCDGCVGGVNGEVCSDKYKSCNVGLVPNKKNTGFIEIETKDNQKLDVSEIETNLAKAGDMYELVEAKKPTKKK